MSNTEQRRPRDPGGATPKDDQLGSEITPPDDPDLDRPADDAPGNDPPVDPPPPPPVAPPAGPRRSSDDRDR